MQSFFKHFLIYSILHYQCLKAENDSALFEPLPSSKTHITFINNVVKRPGVNILNYMDYYNGGGVAVGDINNDGLSDIYFTANNKSSNKLYLNKGNFEFEDITTKAGVEGNCDWASGVTMADVNGDGYLDIYVSAITTIFDFKGANQLFINNRNGTFTDKAEEYGLNIKGMITQSAFFDYDHDGDLDCFILSQSMLNNLTVLDSKKRNQAHAFFKSRLMQNNLDKKTNKFTDVSTKAGIYQSSIGYGLGLSIADVNNDGWEDIYVGNDFYEDDYYYVNNGNGTFTETGKKCFSSYSQNSMGNDIADYNNDGQLDIITVDMLANEEFFLKRYSIEDELSTYNFKYINNGYHHQLVKNSVHTNNGNGKSFSETAVINGVWATDWSWAPLFADFDNDGNKDLLISAGIPKNLVDADFIKYRFSLSDNEKTNEPFASQEKTLRNMADGISHPFLFKGDGVLEFNDVSEQWGTKKIKGCFNGAAYADLNNDGKLDIIMNSVNSAALILKNNLPDKNYISISLKARGLNTNAIGAKVYLFNNNKIQYQQLMLTRGFESSVDPRLNFGLNTNSTIDSILIVWPNQKHELLKNVKANQQLTISQSASAQQYVYEKYFPTKKDEYEEVTEKLNINLKHNENEFNDFYVQPLIPHELSQKGPKIAVGDVNADGTDDFYLCGASGYSGHLIVQTANGEFTEVKNEEFIKDSIYEEVDAQFFDADKDSDLDLLIISGGNQFKNNDNALADRLYINNGKGIFTKSVNNLPKILTNKSCIALADVENDGDIDIFWGGLADTKKYGVAQNSYLLLNNGKGVFSISANAFDSLGMVTAAVFSDINKDGYNDLIVVGEWMPITLFINKKGTFSKSALPNSSGLWQTVYLSDINNDGNIDFLAGNWGHNNKFYKNKTSPLKLYAGDFYKNGNQSQLISYIDNGVEYSFMGKEQIERVLPTLKKKYLYFSDFSGVPFNKAFSDFTKNTTPLTAEILGSVVGIGDGNGNFAITELPENLQLSPICVFQKNVFTNEYFAGGNYFGLSPYEGRYDEQALALIDFTKSTVIKNHQNNLAALRGQVKDIKILNSVKFGKLIIVARNNEKLLFYKPNSK